MEKGWEAGQGGGDQWGGSQAEGLRSLSRERRYEKDDGEEGPEGQGQEGSDVAPGFWCGTGWSCHLLRPGREEQGCAPGSRGNEVESSVAMVSLRGLRDVLGETESRRGN